MQELRVGFGYDVHKMEKGYKLTLGGVVIPYKKGLVGHSDADVVIHAICDALLGAANLRDIGYHFPDTDERFKGIDSKVLLREVVQLLLDNGYVVHNVDCMISLEKPKIQDYIPQMQHILAKLLNIDENYVSIKATTTEKLGFIGSEKGAAAFAVALIKSKPNGNN